ncbi:MAG: hypothetical protein U0165_04560 [Polyangiaceae bacterium]
MGHLVAGLVLLGIETRKLVVLSSEAQPADVLETDLIELLPIDEPEAESQVELAEIERDATEKTERVATPSSSRNQVKSQVARQEPAPRETSESSSSALAGASEVGDPSHLSSVSPSPSVTARPRRSISLRLPEGSFDATGEGGAPGRVSLERTDNGQGVRRVMARDQADRDRNVGLGPGSAVALAAESAVREVGAPDGWAIFDVTLNGQGIVSAVKLVDAATAGWQKAAPAIQGKLASTPVKLPASFSGARVRVKLMAKFQLPNGQKHLVEPVMPLERVGEPGVTQTPDNSPMYTRWWEGLVPPADTRVMPTRPSGVAESLPAGSHHLMLPLVKFDPAKIGANRTFVVGATVLDVAPL